MALEYFEESYIERLFRFIGRVLCKLQRFEQLRKKDKRFFDSKRVQVRRAPEPTDVYWENLHIKFRGRCCRTMLTWIVALCLVALCLFSVYLLQ